MTLLWRRGFTQVLLKKCNYLGVKVLVKVNAIEARRVGTDGRKLFCLFFGAERPVLRCLGEIALKLQAILIWPAGAFWSIIVRCTGQILTHGWGRAGSPCHPQLSFEAPFTNAGKVNRKMLP